MSDFPRMSYDEAMQRYGSDKPDVRFGMEFCELNDVAQGKGFGVFDNAELVVGICAEGQAEHFSNKDIKELTEWMQRPQIGAKGLVWIKVNSDPNDESGRFRSSVSKFYSEDDLALFAQKMGAKPGDMMLVLSGEAEKTRKQLNELRLEMGRRMGLMKPGEFKPLWVVNFPLLEWDEDAKRFFAMHHPFTSPLPEDAEKMMSGDHETLKNLRANAYDLVINGVEIGGGSIRIHDRSLQEKNFNLLGFTPEQAEYQFGFLLGAFEYGAPPHGGIAFGFDRLCAVMRGQTSIRDFIAFPKNNMGRDMMIDAPSEIDEAQLKELSLAVTVEKVKV